MIQPHEYSREPGLGEVIVEKSRDGWYFVQIGRSRGVKRFNLSDDEAAQLIAQLRQLAPQGGAGR